MRLESEKQRENLLLPPRQICAVQTSAADRQQNCQKAPSQHTTVVTVQRRVNQWHITNQSPQPTLAKTRRVIGRKCVDATLPKTSAHLPFNILWIIPTLQAILNLTVIQDKLQQQTPPPSSDETFKYTKICKFVFKSPQKPRKRIQ